MSAMENYWNLGRWGRIPVSMHWTVLIALVWLLLFFGDLLATLVAAVAFFALLLIHEFGHVAVLRWKKIPVEGITLYGIHGETAHGYARSRGDEIAVAWGGIGAQMLVLVIALLLWPLIVQSGSYFAVGVASPIYVVFTRLNIFVMVLALLPIGPFDGRKAWQVIPWLRQRLRGSARAVSGTSEPDAGEAPRAGAQVREGRAGHHPAAGEKEVDLPIGEFAARRMVDTLHMNVRLTALAWLVAALLGPPALADQAIPAPRSDGARTPIRVYSPDSAVCAPLALISPGAGGSENDLHYLAEALSEDGWLAIVLGHSDRKAQATKVRKSRPREDVLDLVTDPQVYRNRLLDIDAALKWVGAPCHAPFSVLIGHSLGAATVMIEAGARNQMDVKGEDRFDAYVAISPQGPGSIFPQHAWSKVRRPMLMLTGTKDKALEGSWQTRTIPFDDLPPGCKWLGVVDGATHMNFAAGGLSGKTEKLTVTTVKAFLESARSTGCAMPPPQAKGITLKAK